MASVDSQLAQLQAKLNDLARVMALSQGAELQAYKQQFRELSAQAATLRTRANMSDSPGAFDRAFLAFTNQAIKVGNAVGEPVGDLLHSTSTVLKLIPLLLVVVVLGAVYWAVKGGVKVSAGR